jgi:hypothetical protein
MCGRFDIMRPFRRFFRDERHNILEERRIRSEEEFERHLLEERLRKRKRN